MPTLLDIMKELDKPGRDPRQIIKVWEFDDSIASIEDLKEGMVLPGICQQRHALWSVCEHRHPSRRVDPRIANGAQVRTQSTRCNQVA